MAIGLVTNESTIFLKEEVTEGTYVAMAAATEGIEALADGLEMNKTRELLERNVLGSTVENESARVGITDVAGSIPVELKASATEGDAPQSLDLLMKSTLGGKRQITADQTSGSGHSSTVITFADTSAFAVGDIVLVKESGAFECRPISAITTNTSITFPFALTNGAPSDSVVVAQVTTYYSDTTNAITMSAEHNLGNEGIKQKIAGLRCASMSLENWSVGQLPTASFSVQGLSLDRENADASFTPDFTADGEAPVTLSACAWLGGTQLAYTELGMSIENTISYINSACDADGRIGSRISNQVANVTFNPYMDDADLALTWDKFNNNDDVSFFTYAYNPSTTAGEFSEVVAVWIPQSRIIEAPVADNDGIVSEALSIRAHKSTGNDSVFMSFI